MTAAFLDALHADPWAETFIDLSSLNASASDAIEANIRRVRDVARAEPQGLRSNSLVVLGPPGAGKTHLFARLRRKLGPRAAFVHVRPLVHTEMTPRFLLGEVVKQLAYGTHGVAGLPQAHAMVGSLLSHLSGQDAFFPSAFLADCADMSDTEREKRLEWAVDQVLGIWQEADESYLRRLLQVPFAKGMGLRRALLAWLSGRDCDSTQLARIGATASLPDELSTSALRTLSVVASLGAPIVVVFDQLENLVDIQGPGPRLLAYANLTAELVDSARGLVLVHMALDTEWARGIEPALNLSQRSRLLMGRDTLSLPTAKQRSELLELWCSQLSERPAAFPWPFTDVQLQRLCQRPGVTPRMLLIDFRRALNGEPFEDRRENEANSGEASSGAEISVDNDERRGLLAEWEERLTEARNAADEALHQNAVLDPARLADGLLACGQFVNSVKLAPLERAQVGHLQLAAADGPVRLAIVQHPHHKSLASALKKLTVLASTERVVVLRERAHELKPTWKETLAKRAELLSTGRARWIWLDREDAISLLALDSLLQGARSGEVSDEFGRPLASDAVARWVAESLDVSSWPVIRQILGTESPAEDDEQPRAARVPSPQAAGTALALLRRLRIASLDRIVREVMRAEPGATRASIIEELEQSPQEVRWFGRTIIGVRLP